MYMLMHSDRCSKNSSLFLIGVPLAVPCRPPALVLVSEGALERAKRKSDQDCVSPVAWHCTLFRAQSAVVIFSSLGKHLLYLGHGPRSILAFPVIPRKIRVNR